MTVSEVGYGRVGELALLTLTGDSSFPRGPARSRLVRTSHPKFARERSQAAQRGPMHALTARRQLCAWPSNDSYESPTPSSKPSARTGDCVRAAKIDRWRHDSKERQRPPEPAPTHSSLSSRRSRAPPWHASQEPRASRDIGPKGPNRFLLRCGCPTSGACVSCCAWVRPGSRASSCESCPARREGCWSTRRHCWKS